MASWCQHRLGGHPTHVCLPGLKLYCEELDGGCQHPHLSMHPDLMFGHGLYMPKTFGRRITSHFCIHWFHFFSTIRMKPSDSEGIFQAQPRTRTHFLKGALLSAQHVAAKALALFQERELCPGILGCVVPMKWQLYEYPLVI